MMNIVVGVLRWRLGKGALAFCVSDDADDADAAGPAASWEKDNIGALEDIASSLVTCTRIFKSTRDRHWYEVKWIDMVECKADASR